MSYGPSQGERPIAEPASMPAGFSKMRSPAICLSNRRPTSNLLINLATAKAIGLDPTES